MSNQKRDPEKEAHWRREFAEWEKTGLTAAEYCRQRGIPYYTFKDRQKTIRQLDAKAAGISRKSLSAQTAQEAAGTKPLARPLKQDHKDSHSVPSGKVGKTALPAGPTVWEAIGDLPDADKYKQLNSQDWVKAKFGKPSKYVQHLNAGANDYSYKREYEPTLLTSSMRTEHTELSRRRFAKTGHGETEPVRRALM